MEIFFNIGNAQQHGTGIFPETRVRDQIRYWKARGATGARIGGMNYTYPPGINFAKQTALMVKEEGLYTMMAFSTPFNPSGGINTYKPGGAYYNALRSFMQWAEANGMNEVNGDNEGVIHFPSIPNTIEQRNIIRQYQLAYLLPMMRAEFSGICSTTEANSNWYMYELYGLGLTPAEREQYGISVVDSWDRFGLQIYGDGGSTANFAMQIRRGMAAFGQKAEFTEFHIGEWPVLPIQRRRLQWLQAERLRERFAIYKQNQAPRICCFTSDWNNAMNFPGWGNDQYSYQQEMAFYSEVMNIVSDFAETDYPQPSQWMTTY